MANHMNLFEPYRDKAAHHEDALTRAFLLVLRGVPVAHAAWLGMVDRAHRFNKGSGVPGLHELGDPEVQTQTSGVPEDIERLVSVVQTDELFLRENDASASARRQVLDGLVVYGTALGIAIENKPLSANIWENQLDVNVPKGVAHDPRVACVTWKDIVSAWGALLSANHFGRAERLMVEDFLAFVEEHFSHLRPYATVRLCGADHGRLTRRVKALLDEVAGPERVAWHRGWGWFINLADGQTARKIGMFPATSGPSTSLVVEFDPGDTTSQARALYRDVPLSAVAALIQAPRWSGVRNFHLMFMTTGFFRQQRGTISFPAYWNLWASNPSMIRRWRRAEFDSAFDTLSKAGIAADADRAEFDRGLVATKRGHADFAPGVTIQWRLPFAEAVDLDDRGELVRTVKEAITCGAEVFRLKLPWS